MNETTKVRFLHRRARVSTWYSVRRLAPYRRTGSLLAVLLVRFG